MDGYGKNKFKQGDQKRTKCACALSYIQMLLSGVNIYILYKQVSFTNGHERKWKIVREKQGCSHKRDKEVEKQTLFEWHGDSQYLVH